jgi:ketosteroid isomerase-like protein
MAYPDRKARELAAMTTATRATIEKMFAAVEAKDSQAVLALFADDAVIVDPHYPVPRMVGKEAIADGLRWAFANLKSFSFPIVSYCESEDGLHAAVEVATGHVARGGMRLNFPQAFMIDTRNDRITRLQAYTPYGPNGIGGLFLKAARLQRRLRRRAG